MGKKIEHYVKRALTETDHAREFATSQSRIYQKVLQKGDSPARYHFLRLPLISHFGFGIGVAICLGAVSKWASESRFIAIVGRFSGAWRVVIIYCELTYGKPNN